MPDDDEFERLNGELRAARTAVQDHLSTAVRVWRNAPPAAPQVPITEAWLDEHEALKEKVDDLERQVVERLRDRY